MEYVLQLWITFKWVIFASIGSGLSVMMDKTQNTIKQKFILFIFGALVSIIAGGAFIEYCAIKGSAVQAFIYWSCGLWGMGIVLQVTKQIPEAIANLRDKFTK